MILAETTGGVTTKYWQAGDTIAQNTGPDTRFLAYDGLGSMRQMTNGASLTFNQTFDPYGNPYADSTSASAPTNLGFTGETTDANGLVFLRARYYNPQTGQFMQGDPARAESNLYGYGRGNPISNIDPGGTCTSPFTFLNAGIEASRTPDENAAQAAFAAAWQECSANLGLLWHQLTSIDPDLKMQRAFGRNVEGQRMRRLDTALGWATVYPTLRDVTMAAVIEPVFAGARANGFWKRALPSLWRTRNPETAFYAGISCDDVVSDAISYDGTFNVPQRSNAWRSCSHERMLNATFDTATLGWTGFAIGDMAAAGWMSIRPSIVGERPGLFGLGKTRAPIPREYYYGGGGSVPIEATEFGTHRGIASNRQFFADEIGLPIRDLSTSDVRITDAGIDVVEQHISRFSPGLDMNTEAIARLRAIANGSMEPTPYDLNFYTHELREFVRYRYLGFRSGEPAINAYEFWNDLHTATLEDYGLTDKQIYHPSIGH